MRPLLHLALGLAASLGLYKLAELTDSSSVAYGLYEAPLVALFVSAVVLALAFGVVTGARQWSVRGRRNALLAAGAVALATMVWTYTSGRGGWISEAGWTTIAVLAVLAAALTVWTWVQRGPSRSDDEGPWRQIRAVGHVLARRRIPVAVALALVGTVVLLGVPFLPASPDVPVSAVLLDGAFKVVVIAVCVAFLLALPEAVLGLAALAPSKREGALVGLGVAACAVVVAIGLAVSSALVEARDEDPALLLFGVWFAASVVGTVILLVAVYRILRVGRRLQSGSQPSTPG
ncbi:MAG TPA: hypothetical protein VGB53_10310 [Rubricoccaceae bacterium]|jgi:hypothetical protein